MAEQLTLQAATALVPFFYGNEENVAQKLRAFISTIDALIQVNSALKTVANVLAKSKLKGLAFDYWVNNDTLQSPTVTWDVIKEKLLERFDREEQPISVVAELMGLTLKSEERVEEFATRVTNVGKKMKKPIKTDEPGNADYNKAMDEFILTSFIKGLPPRLREYTMVSKYKNFEEAVSIAATLEKQMKLYREPIKPSQGFKKFPIHALEVDDSNESSTQDQSDQSVDGLAEQMGSFHVNAKKRSRPFKTTPTAFRPNAKCFNCGKVGHFVSDRKCCQYCKSNTHTIEECIKRIQRRNKTGSGNGQAPPRDFNQRKLQGERPPMPIRFRSNPK